jgi:hypothetical protein
MLLDIALENVVGCDVDLEDNAMQLHLVMTVAMFLNGAGIGVETDAQQMQTPDCVAEVQRVASDWKDEHGENTAVMGWCENKEFPDDKIKEFLGRSLPNGHPPVDAEPSAVPQSAPAPKTVHRPGDTDA